MADEIAQTDAGGTVRYWIEKVQKEEKAHDDWRKAAEDAEREYFDDRKDGRKQLFNLFYSTVQTLQSRLFSRCPVPDVRRRYDPGNQQDQQAKMLAQGGKQAAQLIERALGYTLDTTPFFTNADQAVSDFLIAGLGVPRIKYEAQVQRDESGNPAQITLQKVLLEHVPWRRFHWEPGKSWEDVDWIGIDDYLTKAEIKQQTGKDVAAEAGKDTSKDKTGADKYELLFRVTTIWYRPSRTIYVICWNCDEPLDTRRDSLNLEGFYPVPRPMFANVRSNELVPTPDHKFNAESYAYINRLVQRIQKITGQIKAAGFYDAQLGELASVASADDGVYVPVANLAERLASTGVSDFNKVMATLPLKEKVAVVRELQQLLMGEKARLDEANGIADIVRGVSDPNETMGAQQIKNNWASLRLARKTGEVSRCIRDSFRLMAEVIAEHFTPESLYLMTGMQASQEALQMIKSDVGRALAIDVETDSTIALEDEAEKAQRLEFLNYVGPFLEKMLPAMQQGMMPADVGKELIKFALQSFKHGRTLEDSIDAAPGTMQQLGGMQQQIQQLTQQLEQCQEQLQGAQNEIASHDQGKQMVDGMKAQGAMANAQAKNLSTEQKAANDAQRNEIDAFSAQTDRIAVLTPGTQTTNVI